MQCNTSQLFVMRDGRLVYVQILGVHNQKLADVVGMSGNYVGTKWTANVSDLQLDEVSCKAYNKKEKDPRKLPRMPLVHEGPEPRPLPEVWPGPTGYKSENPRGKRKNGKENCKRSSNKVRRISKSSRNQSSDSDEEVAYLENSEKTSVSPSKQTIKVTSRGFLPSTFVRRCEENDARVELTVQDRALAERYLKSGAARIPSALEKIVRVHLKKLDRVLAERHITGRTNCAYQIPSAVGRQLLVQLTAEDRTIAEKNTASKRKDRNVRVPDDCRRNVSVRITDKDRAAAENHVTSIIEREDRVLATEENPAIAKKGVTNVIGREVRILLTAEDHAIAEKYVTRKQKYDVVRSPGYFGREAVVKISAKDRSIADRETSKLF